eukprot:1156859-Pelagomonas_calceolata.AAC.1
MQQDPYLKVELNGQSLKSNVSKGGGSDPAKRWVDALTIEGSIFLRQKEEGHCVRSPAPLKNCALVLLAAWFELFSTDVCPRLLAGLHVVLFTRAHNGGCMLGSKRVPANGAKCRVFVYARRAFMAARRSPCMTKRFQRTSSWALPEYV